MSPLRIAVSVIAAGMIAALSYALLSSDRVLPRDNAITHLLGVANAPAALLTPMDPATHTRRYPVFAVLSFIQWLAILALVPRLTARTRAVAPPKQSPPPLPRDRLLMTLRILGGIPLGIWPAAGIASLMGLAGEKSGQESATLLLAAQAFYWGCILYPVAFLLGLRLSRRKERQLKRRHAVMLALIPLAWLFVLGGLFLVVTNLHRAL
ncbi:MAG TPA: hypothetical protein VM029_18055 [Opitutaceae bacterium]|nr:hypothetical protein [Opitutaceae bacterium]